MRRFSEIRERLKRVQDESAPTANQYQRQTRAARASVQGGSDHRGSIQGQRFSVQGLGNGSVPNDGGESAQSNTEQVTSDRRASSSGVGGSRFSLLSGVGGGNGLTGIKKNLDKQLAPRNPHEPADEKQIQNDVKSEYMKEILLGRQTWGAQVGLDSGAPGGPRASRLGSVLGAAGRQSRLGSVMEAGSKMRGMSTVGRLRAGSNVHLGQASGQRKSIAGGPAGRSQSRMSVANTNTPGGSGGLRIQDKREQTQFSEAQLAAFQTFERKQRTQINLGNIFSWDYWCGRKDALAAGLASGEVEDEIIDFAEVAMNSQGVENKEDRQLMRDMSKDFSFFDIFEVDFPEQVGKVIRSFSLLNLISERVILLCACWGALITPFILGFHEHFPEDRSLGVWLASAEICTDVIYLLHLFALTKTSVLDVRMGREYCDVDIIMFSRVSSRRFWGDMFSSIPVLPLYYFLSLPRVFIYLDALKLLRAWRCFVSLPTAKGRRFNKWREVMTLMGQLFILAHWTSCISTSYFCDIETQSLLEGWGWSDEPNFQQLIFILSMSTRDGIFLVTGIEKFGTSSKENFFICVMKIVGTCVSSIIFSLLLTQVQRENYFETQHVEKVIGLQQAMASMDLPRQIQLRVIAYYNYVWLHHTQDTEAGQMLQSIPHNLRTEIKGFQYFELVKQTPMFANTERNFVKHVVLDLADETFLPGEYIIAAGDWGDAMYWVIRGWCQIMSAKREPLGEVYPGQFFGELAVVIGGRRRCFIRAESFVVTAKLLRLQLNALLEKFPDNREMIIAELPDYHEQVKQEETPVRTSIKRGGTLGEDTILEEDEEDLADDSGALDSYQGIGRNEMAEQLKTVVNRRSGKGRSSGRRSGAGSDVLGLTGGRKSASRSSLKRQNSGTRGSVKSDSGARGSVKSDSGARGSLSETFGDESTGTASKKTALEKWQDELATGRISGVESEDIGIGSKKTALEKWQDELAAGYTSEGLSLHEPLSEQKQDPLARWSLHLADEKEKARERKAQEEKEPQDTINSENEASAQSEAPMTEMKTNEPEVCLADNEEGRRSDESTYEFRESDDVPEVPEQMEVPLQESSNLSTDQTPVADATSGEEMKTSPTAQQPARKSVTFTVEPMASNATEAVEPDVDNLECLQSVSPSDRSSEVGGSSRSFGGVQATASGRSLGSGAPRSNRDMNGNRSSPVKGKTKKKNAGGGITNALYNTFMRKGKDMQSSHSTSYRDRPVHGIFTPKEHDLPRKNDNHLGRSSTDSNGSAMPMGATQSAGAARNRTQPNEKVCEDDKVRKPGNDVSETEVASPSNQSPTSQVQFQQFIMEMTKNLHQKFDIVMQSQAELHAQMDELMAQREDDRMHLQAVSIALQDQQSLLSNLPELHQSLTVIEQVVGEALQNGGVHDEETEIDEVGFLC